MLIISPNVIPREFCDKVKIFIPSIRFARMPKGFTLYTEALSVDASKKPSQIIHTRVFTSKNVLEVRYAMRHSVREYTSMDYL